MFSPILQDGRIIFFNTPTLDFADWKHEDSYLSYDAANLLKTQGETQTSDRRWNIHTSL